MMTDPIADMLTRIRNAVRVERPIVEMPLSKVKKGLAEVLKREGFIWDFEEVEDEPAKQLRLSLEIRPQRRTRHPPYQAGEQAGTPDLQPGRSVAACAQWAGNQDSQHQPRRDQRS